MSVSVSTSSVVPSLSLDFINSKSLDPRIAFSRNSVATRTNQFGLLENVSANQPRLDYDPVTLTPRGLLIEESRTNRLIYSSQFDNPAWVKTNNPIVSSNVAVAPNSSFSAYSIQASASGTFQYISQTIAVSANSTITASIYVKKQTTETLYGGFAIDFQGGTRRTAYIGVNAITGAVANLTTATLTAYAYAIDSGAYWRIIVIATDNGSNTSCGFLYYANLSTDNVQTNGSTGGVSSPKIIWGAQLEVAAFPTSYIPSTETFTGRTSAATFMGSNGLIQTASSGVARYQYNPLNLAAAPFLLLEPTATNLITYSEDFANAYWSKSQNVTVTSNDTTAPDGTTTADRIVISAATAISGPYNTIGTISGLHTQSWYVKQAATVQYVQLLWTSVGVSSDYANFDLQTGTLTGGTYTDARIQYVGNGWFRISLTSTLAAVAGGCWITAINTSTAVRGAPYPGTGAESFFAWGVQVETGNYATSYMPTTGSTFARAADTSTSTTTNRALETATITNLYPWFNAQEGTLFAETMIANSQYSNGYRYPGSASLDTNNANCIHIFYAINQSLSMRTISSEIFFGNDGSGAQFVNSSPITISDNSINKQTVMYKLNDANGSGNGVSGTTDTNIVVPQVNKLRIGDLRGGGSPLNGWVREVAYYSTRLTETQANSLTM